MQIGKKTFVYLRCCLINKIFFQQIFLWSFLTLLWHDARWLSLKVWGSNPILWGVCMYYNTIIIIVALPCLENMCPKGWTNDVLKNCTTLEHFTIINIWQVLIPLQATLSDDVTSSRCPSLKFISQMRHFTALENILAVKLKCSVA